VDPTFEALLQSWPLDPWVVVPLLVAAAVYLRGWDRLRRQAPHRFGPLHLSAFLGGLAALFIALASPVEPFAGLLLQVHMVQHLLLMMVAPPLLWLGAPLLPLLRGLPAPVRQFWVAPFLRLPALRVCWERLTHPGVAWTLLITATWLWHVPPLYELGLRSDSWHYLEHACFLGTALLFWFPVVQPYPSRPRCSRWLLLPYLLAADIQNTLLSAVLAFSDRVLYPHYDAVPRLWGLTALDDQAAAGVLMWVPGSLAYLVPLAGLAPRLLFGKPPRAVPRRIPLPLAGPPGGLTPRRAPFDLLRVPAVGAFLRWRHARLVLQLPLFVLAAAIIGDGLFGPQLAPLNLAGVLPWIHWRGLVVLGLLAAGNVFCLACPFVLPRRLARRWLPAGRAWPRRLRSKWLAVALLLGFFWAYEAFSLWASPWWTAWLAVAYFLTAFIIDGFFRGAAFCKYLCPIGQFHFVHALVSPLEVRVRDAGRCATCTTKDCLRGRAGVPGCELGLFLPRKAGSMDCTFCLDCIHACPHDNVGVLAAAPGADLLRDPHRSGVGRLSRRYDLAALVLVLVFAAFANAAGMVAPVVELQHRLVACLRLSSVRPVVTGSLIAELLFLPLLLTGAAAFISQRWSGDSARWPAVAARFVYTLVPLGFGMWLAHYSFHFLTSAGAVVPAAGRFAADLGLPLSAPAAGAWNCCATAAPRVLKLEIFSLDLGLLLSLYLGYRAACARHAALRPALKAYAPWAALMLGLFAVGVWILFQPMEMRGALPG
jgi:cytochrome c oxidase assembly factor CtaG